MENLGEKVLSRAENQQGTWGMALTGGQGRNPCPLPHGPIGADKQGCRTDVSQALWCLFATVVQQHWERMIASCRKPASLSNHDSQRSR